MVGDVFGEAVACQHREVPVQINLNSMADALMRKRWDAQFDRKKQRAVKRAARAASYRPNGQRECARRRRQIAAGQLTRANGLAA
jgi:hypothetical protein